jgi:hypothetical protein
MKMLAQYRVQIMTITMIMTWTMTMIMTRA